MRIVLSIFIAGLVGCAPLEWSREPAEEFVEPSFTEDPIYNFKTRIDEGWELSLIDGSLVFTRKTKDGLEIYRPLR